MGNPLARYDGNPYSLNQLLESCSSLWRRTLLVRLKPSRSSLTLLPPMVKVSFQGEIRAGGGVSGNDFSEPAYKKAVTFGGYLRDAKVQAVFTGDDLVDLDAPAVIRIPDIAEDREVLP